MTIQGKRASRRPVLRGWLALFGIAGVIGATTPADAAVAAARQALDERVLAIRAAIRDATGADSPSSADQRLAQYYPWGNWNNWGNWPNWGNWGNWFNR
jgi:hypothetical protein